MSTAVVRFVHFDGPRWGVAFGQKIAPLPFDTVSTGELISRHWDAIHALEPQQATLARSEVKLLAPVTTDQQFICQGINYRSHIEESGMRLSDVPFNTLFTKAPSCITAADSAVVRPSNVKLLDYEVELGLVMRRPIPAGTVVQERDLGDWLAGITIVNDLSARDIQLPQVQFYKGKSYRGFGPVGPVLLLLTPQEWMRWPELHMRLTVNGQTRQDAYCSEMIHQPAATLTELAQIQDLNAGDLIATGTPAGCAARAPGKTPLFVARHFLSDSTKWKLFVSKNRSNASYLRPGDQIRASIRTDDGLLDLGEQTTLITTQGSGA
jgi:2-keto-4-pentenoate hydratase/2-oxohepta-3-ene-1,7-dioic acid hydratase in catechol pathway